MKKYLVFILSLILLYVGAQILSGWVLTTLYVPDVSSLNINTGGELGVGQSPAIQLLGVLLIATLAYVISQKFSTRSSG